MKNYKLISWNVNGVRAILKKDFWNIIENLNPDILALQETKADDLIMATDILNNKTYPEIHWHSNSQRKGYCGVVTLAKIPTIEVQKGFLLEEFDPEGRVIITKFQDFTFLNIYFPNGGQGPHRVDYKIRFYDACLNFMESLRAKGEKLIIAGDYNTAHQEIDLHDPKNNQNTSGFLPIERAWLNKLIEYNYIDTFRHFYPEEKDIYTWWDMKTRSRERNKGWRIDYFFVAPELKDNLTKAFVLPEVIGSDHCPIGIEIRFD